MNNKHIQIGIFALIILSFIGLAGLQLYLYNHNKDLEKQSFDNIVENTLGQIVKKIEALDIAGNIIQMTHNDSTYHKIIQIDSCDTMITRIQQMNGVVDTTVKMHIVSAYDSIDTLVDPQGGNAASAFVYKFEKSILDSTMILDHDSMNVMIKIASDGNDSHINANVDLTDRKLMIEKVVNDLTLLRSKPVMQRIQPAVLDSIITITLTQNALDLNYSFAILDTRIDSLLYTSPGYQSNYITRAYKKQLFPNDLLPVPVQLCVYFPTQGSFLFKRSGTWILLTLFFILVLVSSFVYLSGLLLRQKQFFNHIVNFINNMTHEFKTPVSTLSLVGEALKSPDIIGNHEKLLRYSQVIDDETIRMRNQVEKILQMAALESGQVELSNESVSVHLLLIKLMKRYQFLQEKGKLTCQIKLDAIREIVLADPVHLMNVFDNLVDNAIKYNLNTPNILVTTQNDQSRIVIIFQDNGIGISAQDQKLIFNTYYRVPTGNVHDVKGFGLGLSYVKRIVELLHGEIDVKSQIGKGSLFQIFLPLQSDKIPERYDKKD